MFFEFLNLVSKALETSFGNKVLLRFAIFKLLDQKKQIKNI
jgi:hypothetical protein